MEFMEWFTRLIKKDRDTYLIKENKKKQIKNAIILNVKKGTKGKEEN